MVIEHPVKKLEWDALPVEYYVPYILARHHDDRGHMNLGAVKLKDEDLPMPFGYPEWAAEQFAHLDIEKWSYWTGYWDSACKPGGHGGFVKGFPHAHGWNGVDGQPRGHTLVMMVQAPESGGELGLVDEERWSGILRILPVVGRGIVIEGDLSHGVMTCHGEVPRLVLIATAFEVS